MDPREKQITDNNMSLYYITPFEIKDDLYGNLNFLLGFLTDWMGLFEVSKHKYKMYMVNFVSAYTYECPICIHHVLEGYKTRTNILKLNTFFVAFYVRVE